MNIKKPAKASKNKKPELVNRKRTLSRLMAVQIFYQFEFFTKNSDLEKLKNDLIDNYALEVDEDIKSYRDKIDENLVSNLILGLKNDLETIDSEITFLFKKEADVKKISDILLQILRFAAFELKYSKDTPLKVIIDEYVDLSAFYFDAPKVMFVNSAIENLAKKYREEELTAIKNKKI